MSTTATRSYAAPLAFAAAGLFAATTFAPSMAEATAHAEAPSISVEHQGEVATIDTDTVDAAGFIFDGPRFGSREWACNLFPAIC